MNVINVIGGTKNQRKLAEKIAWFCIKDMMPRYRTLDIEIQLRNCMKETQQLGCCYALETNREFVIEVEKSLYKKDLDDFARTICHEMIHVWQTASKTMKDSSDGQKFWKGKNGKYKNYTDTEYAHQPWEHQAYSLQDKLLEQFKEYYYGNK